MQSYNPLKKGIALIVIVLFVGTSIIPGISGNIGESISVKDVDHFDESWGRCASEQINEADEDKKYEVKHRMVFSKDDLMFDTLMGYDTVVLKDGSCINEIGKPMLPTKQIRIAVPAGMEVLNVHVVNIEREELPGMYNIFPAQAPVRTDDSDKEASFVKPDAEIYTSSNPYPTEDVKLGGQTDLAGQAMIHVTIYPLRYIPKQKTLSLITSIDLVINGVDGYVCGDYLPRKISISGREMYTHMVTGMVENPEDVALQSLDTPPQLQGVPLGDYDYVIITQDSWVDDFQPLADWKTKKGVPATIVTTDWIYSEYSGSNADKIRAFVQDAHINWGTIYFLLGGDSNVIPCYTRNINGNDIPGDTYYGDYDYDWTCEVHVGRASVQVTGEWGIDTFIDKILTYEKDPPLSNYAKTAFFMGFDLKTYGSNEGEGCKEYIKNNYLPGSWTYRSEYDSESGIHKTDCLNYLNQGNNLVNHIDHSSTDFMGTGYVNHGEGINTNGIKSCNNGDHQSIIYSIGCWPCNFLDSECIAEGFVRNPNGGGIAFVGNTRNGWYSPGDGDFYSLRYDRYFFRSLFSQGHYNLGECFSDHKNDAYQLGSLYQYIFYELTLLGDPELPIWTENPTQIDDVDHPTNITTGTGSQQFTVTVTDGGSPVSGALVCVQKDDDVYEYGTTNSQGKVNFTITPTTAGMMYVTVTKHNFLPYEGEAEVSPGQHTLTIYTDGNGHVDKDPDQVIYPFGTSVELTAVADPGWSFHRWSGDLTSSDNPDTIVMDSDKTVTATFEPTIVSILPSVQTVEIWETFNVSVYVEPAEPIMDVSFDKLFFDPNLIQANAVTEGDLFDPYNTFFNGGTIDNVNGEITFVYGFTVPVNTVVNPGYFCSISFTAQDNRGTSDLDLEGVIVSDAGGGVAPIVVNDGVVTVEEFFDLIMSVVGGGTTTPAAGVVHSFACGTVVDLEAFADSCWSFVGWSGSIITMDNPTTITMDGDKAVTATFTEIYYDLTMSVVGGGTTTPAAGVHSYACGTVVDLEAFADPCWDFVDWTGDVADPNDPSTTITMDGNKAVTATFTGIYYDLTISVVGSGTTTPPAPGVYSYLCGTVVPLEAFPDYGWSFSDWSGDLTSSDNPDTIVMDSDKTVTATFKESTIVSILPSAQTVEKGKTFTVDVYVEQTEAIIGASFEFLYFDASLIQADSVTEGDLFDGFLMFDDGTIDNVNGKITDVFLVAQVADAVSDPGSFVTIQFTALYDPGTSTLDLEWVTIPNISGDPLPLEVNDGTVTIEEYFDLTINVVGGGTTTPSAGVHSYPSGTVVDLEAFPDAGWEFAGWSGDITIMDNPTTITMDGNKAVTASFVIPTIVSIDPSAQTVEKGETFTIDVYVEPTEAIIGASFEFFNFDPSLVQADLVTEADLFDGYLMFDDGTIDNVAGTITDVYLVATLPDAVTDPGAFVTIDFTALYDLGTSDLDLEGVIIPNTSGVPLPFIVNDGEVTIVLTDVDPPEITGVTMTTSDPLDTEPGFGWENVTCTVIDDGVGVDEVKIVITDPNMITTEHQMTKIGTDTYYYNTTLTIEGCHEYHIWADDTSGNQNTSSPQLFELPPNEDVDMDGYIHFMDLVAVVLMYGDTGPSYPSPSSFGWVREDVDNDGEAHFMDLVQIVLRYGEYWDQC